MPLENVSYAWATKKILGGSPEFVVVASTSAGLSATGMVLPTLAGSNSVVTTTALPIPTEMSSFNNYTAGYKRNITVGADGARANTTGATLWTNVSLSASYAYVAPTPTRGSAVI